LTQLPPYNNLKVHYSPWGGDIFEKI